MLIVDLLWNSKSFPDEDNLTDTEQTEIWRDGAADTCTRVDEGRREISKKRYSIVSTHWGGAVISKTVDYPIMFETRQCHTF